jgi:hypothetical protein
MDMKGLFLFGVSGFTVSNVKIRAENGRPGLSPSSIVSTPLLKRPYHLNICARNKQLSPYTCLIISTISAAVFPSLKQSLMFVLEPSRVFGTLTAGLK